MSALPKSPFQSRPRHRPLEALATVLSTLAALTAPGLPEARANAAPRGTDPVQDQQVTRFCLASVSAAFEAARKVPPPGIGAYACRCFLDQVSQGAGINTAQAVCRQRTVARYSL